jgi:hypothetical protein
VPDVPFVHSCHATGVPCASAATRVQRATHKRLSTTSSLDEVVLEDQQTPRQTAFAGALIIRNAALRVFAVMCGAPVVRTKHPCGDVGARVGRVVYCAAGATLRRSPAACTHRSGEPSRRRPIRPTCTHHTQVIMSHDSCVCVCSEGRLCCSSILYFGGSSSMLKRMCPMCAGRNACSRQCAHVMNEGCTRVAGCAMRAAAIACGCVAEQRPSAAAAHGLDVVDAIHVPNGLQCGQGVCQVSACTARR